MHSLNRHLIFLLVTSLIFYSILVLLVPLSTVYLLYSESAFGQVVFVDKRTSPIIPIFGTPPVIPALIAFVWQIIGKSEIAAKFVSASFSILSVIATYFLGKELFNERVGFLSGLFLLTHPLFVYYTPKFNYTDIPLTLFVITSLYFFYIGTVKNKPIHLLLSGILIGISTWVKYSGLILYFITFFFVLISQRKSLKNPFLWIAYFISLLIILPNFTYLAGGSAWVAKSTISIPFYQKLFDPYYYIIFPLILLGATPLIFLLIIDKRVDLFQPKYIILILTIVIVFGFYQNITSLFGKELKFLIPAIPPAIILASKELDDITKKKKTQKIKKIVIVYLIITLILSLSVVGLDIYRRPTSLIQAGEFLRNNVEENSIVISNFWPEVSYYSQKTAKWLPSTQENLHKKLQTYKIDYVVLVELKGYTLEFLNTRPDPEWATISNLDKLDFLRKIVQYEDNGRVTAIYEFKEIIENRIIIDSKDNFSFSKLLYN